MHLILLTVMLGAASAALGCARRGDDVPVAGTTTPDRARTLLSMLAHDSLEGREAGTDAAMKAARIIATEMARIGLEPLGDSGFLQPVPMPREGDIGANVVGLLRGSDAALRDEYVIVGAHFDHVGMDGTAAVNGDSIFNGADDDASGVVAVLEAARQLVDGGAPKRSVIFVAFTGEESGMTGTRWFIANPPRPLTRITQVVADIQVEMIGRPDSLAGGAGKAWLTGYERSSMGEVFASAGVPVIADPRPAMNFFARSDNYPFALAGIPAHTISSYGGHADYHQVSDEVETIDFAHMASVVNVVARAARVVADGPRPAWNEGGRP